ncbi:hypothetical protein K493DRAFT_405996 [Basidiobolus meristosporus CBS 931.73]|uniref:RING-type E3 ubiquitin transferase n=1 Tax=Basidiobolus meristosporus CBS 931.73 TaxID=1314790 RepID=A0A1Y1YQA2_9FUNG|nr:hypothetical protein K493DRAFT_271824 [Basidiobolus meristosporus CBS 931.73]ORY00146.1 hypothetical protein K493DRAFT_405996 [Basidiobolus meristosporus CBS 931.73]|eukprot:ORX75884.1 hypothetical protein K493DRAFT_271824 [Basidiobolus meristosporus CBS 931.73]
MRLWKLYSTLLLGIAIGLTSCVHATIIVLSTNDTYQDRIAAFGPRLTEKGINGTLIPLEMLAPELKHACTVVSPPTVTDWIALVERGKCSFIEKVRNMQKSGAIAVIVGDAEFDSLVTMYASGDTTDVKIPSVFTQQSQYKQIRYLSLFLDEPMLIRLTKDDMLDWPLLDVIIVTLLSPTIMMAFIYGLWRFRQRQREKRDLAPVSVISNLPKKKFYKEKRKGNEPQECAICLEDYIDEDELRILPCKHEFHVECIDPWLTTRKKFCPICKQDTCPSEDTPLLPIREGNP